MKEPSPSRSIDVASDDSGHDPSEWVDLHGDALYRFAILRVEDPDIAEDLVQDTFLSALQAIDRFRGGSSLRTWLIGILKHKIIDFFRKSVKEVPTSDLHLWEEEDDKEFFDRRGHWKRPLQEWKETPEKLVESKEFWKSFQSCLSALPESHRRAFSLRELDGIESEEVCKILAITPTNLWVIMHRARSKLRKCLDANWFQAKRRED